MLIDWRNDIASQTVRAKTFFVIDDVAMVREFLRNTIQNMETSVTFSPTVMSAVSYNDAIFRLKEMRSQGDVPEIILCDYYLGDGKNGQDLFEEMRESQLLPESSVFVMVTAESEYEQVASIVELAPDDYILKPFKPEALKVRLISLIQKKEFFLAYYTCKEKGDLQGAIRVLDQLAQHERSKFYRIDIRRYLAETLMATGEVDRAAEIYAEIVDEYNPPWSRAGLAKAKVAQKKYAEAELLVDEIVEAHPQYLAARDMKSRMLMARQMFAQAKDFITKTLEISPRSKARKRELIDAAIADGDHELAKKLAKEMMASVLAKTFFSNAAEMLRDMRLMLTAGHPEQVAVLALKCGGVSMTEDERLALAAMRVLALGDTVSITSDHEDVVHFVSLRNVLKNNPFSFVDCAADVVRACLAIGDIEIAEHISTGVLRDRPKAGYAHLVRVYAAMKRPDLFKGIQVFVALELVNKARQHKPR